MAQKDVGNKVPIYKLKTTKEVMDYYDEWGENDKYNKDMVDWNYTGPKETVNIFLKYEKNKDALIFDAGCGTGLVGLELKKFGFKNFHGADLSQKLLSTIPSNLYKKLLRSDLKNSISLQRFVLFNSCIFLSNPYSLYIPSLIVKQIKPPFLVILKNSSKAFGFTWPKVKVPTQKIAS